MPNPENFEASQRHKQLNVIMIPYSSISAVKRILSYALLHKNFPSLLGGRGGAEVEKSGEERRLNVETKQRPREGLVLMLTWLR